MLYRYVLVSGGRDYDDAESVHWELDKELNRHGMVFGIQGGCKTGTDKHTRDWCDFHEMPCLTWPARWKRGSNGKGEGPQRNYLMVLWLHDLMLALRADSQNHWEKLHKAMFFWDGKSKGTKSCLQFAMAYGLNIEVFGPGRDVYQEMLASGNSSVSPDMFAKIERHDV